MIDKTKTKLLIATFDGSLKNIKIKPKCMRTKVEFDVDYYEHKDGDTESAIKVKFVFKNVVSMDFEVNYFDNYIGAELFGFYEIFEEDRKLAMMEKVFQNRKEGFLLAGGYDYDPEEEADMLNYRHDFEEVQGELEKYHLYQQQTQGGIYYILAEDFEIVEKKEAIALIEPTEEYAEDIWAFRQEVMASNDVDKFAGCGNLGECESALEWIEGIKKNSKAETCDANKVPANVYIAVRTSDNRIVGVIDLRHHINHPVLSSWGGHIGYYVRPSERQKGYGTEMLRLDVQKAKERGLDRVLVTCDTENVVSEKVIQNNGGCFESETQVDGICIKRYWIEV